MKKVILAAVATAALCVPALAQQSEQTQSHPGSTSSQAQNASGGQNMSPHAEILATRDTRQIRHTCTTVLRLQEMPHCAGLYQLEQRLHALLGAHREQSLLLEQGMVSQNQGRESRHVRCGSRRTIRRHVTTAGHRGHDGDAGRAYRDLGPRTTKSRREEVVTADELWNYIENV